MSKLPRSAPEKQGVKSQAIVDFINSVKENKHEFHSFMLLKNGHVISECWWEPYGKNYRHQLFSLSKSFTSTAVGMAVNEGLLTVDTLLSDIFTDEFKDLGNRMDEKMAKMTVKNILTMGTGAEYENWSWGDNGNNIKSFLQSHLKNEPGSKFAYSSIATYMQSAAITRLTKQKLVDYLKPRLFDPLGIEPIWDEDNLGINFGGFGLNITTDDIAKFGQLYLQKGVWNGQQIIPEKWVKEATSKQIDNAGNDLNANGDWNQGYGYQFWMCQPDGVYRGDGAYGQYCIVMPNENSVIAITSDADMQKVLNLIWDILLPALKENNAPSDDTVEYKKVKAAQKNLSHLTVSDNVLPFPKFRGEYKIKDESKIKNHGTHGVEKIFVEFTDNECILAMHYKNSHIPIVFRVKNNEWIENTSGMNGFYRLKTFGEWQKEGNENIFKVVNWHYETPEKSTTTIKFSRDKSKLTFKHNDHPVSEMYVRI
jgi:CubicO group peptidase (beta-lactamase class C family)